jgi:hypothetical protein
MHDQYKGHVLSPPAIERQLQQLWRLAKAKRRTVVSRIFSLCLSPRSQLDTRPPPFSAAGYRWSEIPQLIEAGERWFR